MEIKCNISKHKTSVLALCYAAMLGIKHIMLTSVMFLTWLKTQPFVRFQNILQFNLIPLFHILLGYCLITISFIISYSVIEYSFSFHHTFPALFHMENFSPTRLS